MGHVSNIFGSPNYWTTLFWRTVTCNRKRTFYHYANLPQQSRTNTLPYNYYSLSHSIPLPLLPLPHERWSSPTYIYITIGVLLFSLIVLTYYRNIGHYLSHTLKFDTAAIIRHTDAQPHHILTRFKWHTKIIGVKIKGCTFEYKKGELFAISSFVIIISFYYF